MVIVRLINANDLETLKGQSAELKGWTGNELLYESCTHTFWFG